ncbi:ATP-dependent Clp protease proteolytic subunit [Pseudooceanicola sp. CBS1P-1]|nr:MULTISPECIES: head maturation protease, ClpP-related [Pseudooceanicola]MBT9386977.1 ATP-dependent Clp protease proteolytic subunit [Pseudooceanicola endophyticus]
MPIEDDAGRAPRPVPAVVEGILALEGTLVPEDYIAQYGPGAFSAAQVRTALQGATGDLTVRVNSPGGDPREGEAIRVMLAEYPGRITVQVVGQACSAASLMIMSADRIEMSSGSVMMIHDPSSYTFGTVADHEQAMLVLNALADAYAAVYAAKAGRSVPAMRQIMREELWMDAQRAVSEGFADGIMAIDLPDLPGVAMASARAAWAQRMQAFQAVAMTVPVAPQGGVPGAPQLAMMAAIEEAEMPEQTQAPVPPVVPPVPPVVPPVPPAAPVTPPAPSMQDGIAAERQRIVGIQMAARTHLATGALSQDMVDGLITEGLSMEAASVRMLQALSAAPGQGNVQMGGARSRILRDDRETRRIGMTEALTARLSGAAPQDERARPYMDSTIHEIAAFAMGRERPSMGGYAHREDIIMQAMQTTSDFPNILSTSVNRILASTYDLVEPTFAAVSREMSFNDFREHDVVRADEFPTLQKVTEAGEIKFGAIGDSSEVVALGAYATGLAISRQALVNDDLGAIQSVIDSAAAIVPEFEEATFWAYFLSNAKLADGKAMFHADHKNLATTAAAISETSVGAGYKALRTMKAADGKRNILSNAPSILLVGPELEMSAKQFLSQNLVATKTTDINIFSGELRPVVTEQIEDSSWYLLVDPQKRTHNFKHGYLAGRSAPRVRVDEPFGVQGMRMTLEHDFGVGGVNYRGGYKNAGA